MDNTLKLLLGVLAVSGLIALLVPSQTPSAPPADVATAPKKVAGAVPLPEPAVENDFDPEIDEDDQSAEEPEEDDFKLGEPSIDGQPFGGSYDPPSNNPNPNRNVDFNPDPVNNAAPTMPFPTNSESTVAQ
jgi:hypothetical protein